MKLSHRFKETAKDIGVRAAKLAVVGAIAANPLVDKLSEAYADIYSNTYFVEADGSDCPGGAYGSDCFDSVGAAVGQIDIDATNNICHDPASDCDFTINVGAGTFDGQGSTIDCKYPTQIIGQGEGVTTLTNYGSLEVGLSNSSLSFENLTLDNSYIEFGGEKAGFPTGNISDSTLNDTNVKLFAGTDVSITGNNFINSGAKSPGDSAITISPISSDSTPSNLDVRENVFNNYTPNAAIHVESGASVTQEGGNNTFNNSIVYEQDGEGIVVLEGNFINDVIKSGGAVIRGNLVKDENGVRQLDAKELLDFYLTKGIEPEGTVYLTRQELVDANKLTGVNVGNVDVINPQYVNPHDLAVYPKVAGLTNLEHNDLYGFLGYGGDSGSGYEDRKRTFDNVDGDLYDNVTETMNGTNPYDINDPKGQEFPEVPTTSKAGLYATALATGIAGAYALSRKDRRAAERKGRKSSK